MMNINKKTVKSDSPLTFPVPHISSITIKCFVCILPASCVHVHVHSHTYTKRFIADRILILSLLCTILNFPGDSVGKETACNAGDLGLIPVLGRSPGEGNALYYSKCGVVFFCTQDIS